MRRVLLGVVAVVALAVLAIGLWQILSWRAQRAAEVREANEQVQAAIATRYDAMHTAATAGGDSAAMLHLTLQEHLTVSERSDEELATDRRIQQASLAEAGRELQRLADEPPPEVPERADEDAVRDDLAELADAQERAGELGERFVGVADGADRWAEALGNLREHADRYVATVEGQPDTSNPDRLRQLWEEERQVLREYREAAEQARERPGLQPLADAYLDYIDANLEFANEAIALLEAGEIDEYNERLRETYGEEDPFGFQAAVAEATEQSLDVGVLAEMVDVRDEASAFAIELEERRRDVAPTPRETP